MPFNSSSPHQGKTVCLGSVKTSLLFFSLTLTLPVLAQLVPRIDAIGVIESEEQAPASNLPFSGDFDGDGDVDLVLPGTQSGSLSIWSNDGTGNFSASTLELIPSSYLLAAPALSVDHLFIGDVDQDGDYDVVIGYLFESVGDVEERQLACLTALNDGSGNLQFPPALPNSFLSGIENVSCAIIDLVDWDHDGDLDLMSVTTGSNNIGWRENLGGGVFSTLTRLIAPLAVPTTDFLGNPSAVIADAVFGDVNSDGYTDLYVTGFDSVPGTVINGPGFELDELMFVLEPRSLLILNDGTGVASSRQILPLSNLGVDVFGSATRIGDVALLDLNNDGSADLVFSNTERDPFGNPLSLGTSFVLSEGGAEPFPPESFEFAFPLSAAENFDFERLVDFDGDGSLEYASQSGFIRPSVFGPELSSEFDFFGASDLVSKPALSADYDGDGDLDFIASNPMGDSPDEIFLVRNQIVDETSALTFFLQEQGLVGAQANPNADPDGDERTNFEELIASSNPMVSDDPSFDPFLLEVTPLRQAAFTVSQVALDAGVTYEVFVSVDLDSWESLPISSSGTTGSLSGVPFVSVSSADPMCFFQLRISP